MIQQAGDLSGPERALSALVGLSFSVLALTRGGALVRTLNGLAGAALLSRAYAGNCGLKAAITGEVSLREGLAEQWRRMGQFESRAREKPSTAASAPVDPAVGDSFPASDPPASRLPDEPPINADAKWRAARDAEGA